MADAAPTQPATHDPGRPDVPLASKGDNASIRDSLVLTANFVASAIVDCGRMRKCALTIKYDADASGTANTPTMIIMASNAATVPLFGDDEWGALAELENTGEDAVQTDSFPAGVDMTITPEFVTKKLRPLAITTHPSDAGTDKLRMFLILDVSAIKWFFVMAKEEGDTGAGDLGVLQIDAALST